MLNRLVVAVAFLFLIIYGLAFNGLLNSEKKKASSAQYLYAKSFQYSDYLAKADDWYRGDEGKSIAKYILSYQFESGGWYKDNNMRTKRDSRLPDRSATIDNGATTSQLFFLLRSYRLNKKNDAIQESIRKGLKFLFEAQYESGGWPQGYPLDGSYRDLITFNDNATVNVLKILHSVFRGENRGLLSIGLEQRAEFAYKKGLAYIHDAQVINNGKRTAWCQQYRTDRLECAGGRSYELAGLASRESVAILRFLKAYDPEPSKTVISSAMDWLREVAICDKEWIPNTGQGRPRNREGSIIWSRYYDFDTYQPFFSGRDGIKTYDIENIEYERRKHYEWFGSWAGDLIDSAAEVNGSKAVTGCAKNQSSVIEGFSHAHQRYV